MELHPEPDTHQLINSRPLTGGGVADFDRTEVPSAFGGQGIAGRLVHHAMDDIRATGEWKVRPSCSYVVRWFAQHPDYADLLA